MLTPSAGPSSPSPAEELYAAALDIHLAMFERSAPRHSARIAATLPILSALVRSVEERTLRGAAKAGCLFCIERVPLKQMDTGQWFHEPLRPGMESRNNMGWAYCKRGELWDMLASLKDTRER